mgnify:CR=1 FL=1
MLKKIRQWINERKFRKAEIRKQNIWDSVFLAKAKLFISEMNLTSGENKTDIETKIDALMSAKHICPGCKYLDGTCLFGLDLDVDKVVKCVEFKKKEETL